VARGLVDWAVMRSVVIILVSAALFAGFLAACRPDRQEEPGQAPEKPAQESTPTRPGDNLLLNPSFENDSPDPWFDMSQMNPRQWGVFAISAERAHSGERSALLELDSGVSAESTRVLGAVQELGGVACPERLSGWYFVEGWERAAEKQYLQVAVIAHGGPMPSGLTATSYQVAQTLAGVTENPLPALRNRRFVVSGPPEPVEGEWVWFEIELAQLFEEHWGRVPGADGSLRVFFEVRYDDRDRERAGRARVWFDDLYLGPDSRAPDPG